MKKMSYSVSILLWLKYLFKKATKKGVKMKKIQILGTGCPTCEKVTERAIQAANELGIEYELEKVKDITEIIKMGVVKTPGIAVDGVVKISGKLPSIEEIKEVL